MAKNNDKDKSENIDSHTSDYEEMLDSFSGGDEAEGDKKAEGN